MEGLWDTLLTITLPNSLQTPIHITMPSFATVLAVIEDAELKETKNTNVISGSAYYKRSEKTKVHFNIVGFCSLGEAGETEIAIRNIPDYKNEVVFLFGKWCPDKTKNELNVRSNLCVYF